MRITTQVNKKKIKIEGDTGATREACPKFLEKLCLFEEFFYFKLNFISPESVVIFNLSNSYFAEFILRNSQNLHEQTLKY